MATSTLPQVELGRGARLRVLYASAAQKFKTTFRPAKAPLKNLAQIPLTVAAFVCADICAWTFNDHVGWAASAVLLFWMEHLIADED